ncbi:hypothetical protein JCM30237_11620 [Halolamina litorea]|uniref:Uncharacterized protein n=1 Tax=Halolamina litorea TaxID=1515593 RepID=A0ABD6BP23_9EURY|nr:hypothetical protein [Halolamina litorea]
MDPVAPLLLVGLWLFDAAVLAPLLLFESTRRLFAGRPTGTLLGNYAVVATAYAVVHVLVLFAPGIATGTVGVGWIVASTLALLLGSALAVGVVAPRLDWWDPSAGDGWDGRLALVAVAAGYVGVVVVLAVVAALGVLLVFANYPG